MSELTRDVWCNESLAGHEQGLCHCKDIAALRAQLVACQRKHDELGAILIAGQVQAQQIQREIIHPQIAALRAQLTACQEELEAQAWKTSPAMAQAQIDQLNAKLTALEQGRERLLADDHLLKCEMVRMTERNAALVEALGKVGRQFRWWIMRQWELNWHETTEGKRACS